jgi:predicted transcriptional regulator
VNSEEPISKPDLYVLARIIKVLQERGKLNRTTLATSTGLAYDRMIRYIAWMEGKDFIELDGKENVTLTRKGSECYDNLVKWILEYVGKVRFPKFTWTRKPPWGAITRRILCSFPQASFRSSNPS